MGGQALGGGTSLPLWSASGACVDLPPSCPVRSCTIPAAVTPSEADTTEASRANRFRGSDFCLDLSPDTGLYHARSACPHAWCLLASYTDTKNHLQERFAVCIEEDEVLGFDALRYMARLVASRRGLGTVCEVMVEPSRSVLGAVSWTASPRWRKHLPASAKGTGACPGRSIIRTSMLCFCD